MKIYRIAGISSFLVLALATGLYLSSRPGVTTGVTTKQERPIAAESNPDFVPYREIKIIPTTVCSVVKNPSAFVTQPIAFTADVQSDCYHFTLLVDSSCNRGVSFTVPDSILEQWQPIDDVICVGMRRESKPVRGRFTGRLVKGPERSDGLFPYHVDLTAIQDVRIR